MVESGKKNRNDVKGMGTNNDSARQRVEMHEEGAIRGLQESKQSET